MNKIKKDKEKEIELPSREIDLANDIKTLNYEDFEDIKEEESKLKKLIKKLYISFLAIFLIIILLLNGVFGTHLSQIMAGKIISKLISENYTISLNSQSTVFFGKENYEALLSLYRENQRTEIKVCLLGEKKESNYYVKGLYIPTTFQKEVYSVTSVPCNNSTIISLHTHPILHCIFSTQDMDSYTKYKNIDPDRIMALMCDEKRFSFFGY